MIEILGWLWGVAVAVIVWLFGLLWATKWFLLGMLVGWLATILARSDSHGTNHMDTVSWYAHDELKEENEELKEGLEDCRRRYAVLAKQRENLQKAHDSLTGARRRVR